MISLILRRNTIYGYCLKILYILYFKKYYVYGMLKEENLKFLSEGLKGKIEKDKKKVD